MRIFARAALALIAGACFWGLATVHVRTDHPVPLVGMSPSILAILVFMAVASVAVIVGVLILRWLWEKAQ